ncbi:Uncharacterised protein [Bordetella pertussis]|nr:Uncharacterised protein [Bordetella pertussis]
MPGAAYWRTPRSLGCAASQAAIGFLRTLAVAALPAAPRL